MTNRQALRHDIPHRAPFSAGTDVRFVNALRRASGAPGLRKAERTRLALLAAVAELLEAGREQSSLRVSDITAGAGIAHGTFYRYFVDREAAVDALIGDFATFLRERLAGVREGEPASPERVRAATLTYVRLFRANSGLMRCLMDLGESSAGSRGHFHALNREWNGRVAAAIARHRAQSTGASQVSAEAVLPIAYALGGMIDEFLAQIYLRRDPALSALAEDEVTIAALLTKLWCLGAYGHLPRNGGNGIALT